MTASAPASPVSGSTRIPILHTYPRPVRTRKQCKTTMCAPANNARMSRDLGWRL